MIFNTALCFSLAGFSILLAHLPFRPHKYTYLTLGIVILLCSMFTMSQDIFQFGRPLGIYIGRDTTAAYILTGIVFMLLPFSDKKSVPIFIQALIFSVFLLGVSVLVGYLIKNTMLTNWYRYSTASIHTSVGVTVLALGLWCLWSRSENYTNLYHSNEDKKILLISFFTLFWIALLVGAAGVAIIARQNNIDIWQSIDQQLEITFPTLLLAITIGFLLLYGQIKALFHKAARSEQAALANLDLLNQNETALNSLVKHAVSSMAMLSLEGKWLKVNPALCKLLGYSETEILTMDLQKITPPSDLQHDLVAMQQMLDGLISNSQSEKRYIQKSGGFVWVSCNVSLARDTSNKPLYFIMELQNINSQKEAEHQLKYIAYHDTLTGLPNRTQLELTFNQMIASARRHHQKIALLSLDLDHFKGINVTYGHDAGDFLLQQVAERLKKCIRATDFLARLGGDEFVFVVTEILSMDDIVTVTERVFMSLSEPFVIKGKKIPITTSMGISCYPSDGEDVHILLRNADLALADAKAQGRKKHQFFSSLSVNE